jgi:alkyl hydroperoxide reductase subunit F
LKKEDLVMSQALYDTIIIGGGPAGAGSAVYAARKKMRTLLITEEFGGQSFASSGIENWIGEEKITGVKLAEKLERHVRAQEGVEIEIPEKVTKVKEVREDHACIFEVTTDQGKAFRSKTLIISSGARRRRMKVPGEKEFEGKGVAFCSTCDAPFFKDQDVAIVGGGNASLEAAIDLFPYAQKIYILARSELKGDPATEEKVVRSDQVKVIRNVEVEKILGDQSVTALIYRSRETNERNELSIGGVFVEIGSVPNSEFVKDMVKMNQDGEIMIDHRTAKTSKEGIFAAGDVTDDPFKQNNISAGDGVRAALSAYSYLLNIKKHSPCEEPRDE